ncbi:MAG: NAD(P)-dependent oxidoreductase, partial [Coriobacteriia bacterium]
TARGGIYQTEALVEALRSGKVVSAAIDVFEVEPCTESPLHELENVILTPHLGASTDEAQDRAGDQIAELIIAGLAGEMVPTAVNVAPVAPEVMEKVGPYIPLAESLGAALAQFAPGGITEVDVLTIGQLADTDTRILKTAVLKGLLGHVSDEPVNLVNAGYYAEQRGLKVTETKRAEMHDYTNMLVVRATTATEPIEIAAALIGKGNEPRLVSLFGYDLDMAPGEHMLFFRYPDRPGMIGKVGTILGEASINIASMQVGRTAAGGTALMGLVVDTEIDETLLARIKDAAEMTNAWSIDL